MVETSLQRSNSSSRRRAVKKGLDVQDGRRKREDARLQIRKAKRDGQITKRRNLSRALSGRANEAAGTAGGPAGNSSVDPADGGSMASAEDLALATEERLPEIMQMLAKDGDVAAQLRGAAAIRRVLSKEEDPPIDKVLGLGALPLLIKLLGVPTEGFKLIFEATWAITNIASGSADQTRAVVEGGGIPPLVRLLRCNVAEVRDQAVWALGNIAGDCIEFRDIISQVPDAIPALLANMANPASITLLSNCTWTMSNLCRLKPQPSKDVLSAFLPAMTTLVTQTHGQKEYEGVVVDCLWALSYASDGPNENGDAVVATGILPKLMQIIQEAAAGRGKAMLKPALRTTGNIVTGSDHSTQAALDHGLLPALTPLLDYHDTNTRKEAAWALSNVAGGTKKQVGLLVGHSHGSLLQKLIAAVKEERWVVRKEATYTCCNIVSGGSRDARRACVQSGIVSALCSLLDCKDVTLLMLILDSLENLLRDDEAEQTRGCYGGVATIMDENDGIDALEALQTHENERVYNAAVQLITQYFGGEEEDEDAGFAAIDSASGQFSFGADIGAGNFDFSDQQPVQGGGFNFGV